MKSSRYRTRVVVFFFAFWTAVGTIGYAVTEGWSWWDSLYMTVITLTAVGYEEVHPLTDPGRVLTMVILAGGLTGLGLWFALVTSWIFGFDLRTTLRRNQMAGEMANLKDHVIVCGAGRTGTQVIEELQEAGMKFVVIEIDEARVRALREDEPDVLLIHADATHDQTLREAGLDRAVGLLSCLREDTANLYVCLSARALSTDLTIVARAEEEESMSKMYLAGANHVISPIVTGAIQMAAVLVRPSVVSFLDVATRAPHLALRLEQARVDPRSPLVGSTLAQAKIPQHMGLVVIALRKGDTAEGFVFNPEGRTVLEAGDEMIVLGSAEQVVALKEFAAP